MKAVIIGAGGGGLAALNSMLRAGFDVEVLERNNEIGGIWSSTRYPNLTIHSRSFNYRFIGFSSLSGKSERATREEILDYMNRFVAQQDGHRHIRFHTEVESISYNEDKLALKCEVIAKDQTTGQRSTIDCDVVVCALGFSNGGYPHIPSFAGAGNYKGTIVHSSQFTPEMLDDILANRKKVVVYGAGKSSHELLSLFEGRPEIDLTWIYRKSLWAISYDKMYDPHRLRFVLKFSYYLFLCSLRQKMGNYNRLLYVLERPLIWNRVFLNPLEPGGNIFQNRMAIMRANQFDYLRSVRSIKSEIVNLEEGGATLADNRKIPANYLICATGYERAANLPRVLLTKNGETRPHDFTSRHTLYHNMIDPALPAIALFTANAIYSQQIFGFSIAAEWLARFYTGKLAHGPSIADMETAIQPKKGTLSPWCSNQYLSKGGPYYFDKDNFVLSGILHELGVDKRIVWRLLMNATHEQRFNAICKQIGAALSLGTASD